MWDGSPADGILLARQNVKAETQYEALRLFMLPCVRLVEEDAQEISIKVELKS